MKVRSFKKWAAGVAMTVAFASSMTPAHALQFSQGDAVLVLYGNNTEYVQNLGSFSTLLSTGIDLDLSSTLANLNVSSPNAVKYTIVGNTSTDFFFGDKATRASFSALQLNQVAPGNYNTGLAGWSGQLGIAGDARSLIPATDALSFSSNLDPSASGTLGGMLPTAKAGFSTIDSTLYLLDRANTGAAASLAQLGTAFLSSTTGHFVIATSVVPVPAAVILFATGIVGLAGMARRRVMGA